MQNLRISLDAQWIMGTWRWNLRVTEDVENTPTLMHHLAGGQVDVGERADELSEALAVLSAVVRQTVDSSDLPGVG